jgi:hypothetical protein
MRIVHSYIQRTCTVKKEQAEAEDGAVEDNTRCDGKQDAEKNRDIEDKASDPNHVRQRERGQDQEGPAIVDEMQAIIWHYHQV